tara:strand:+ start:4236 stop:4397 length:162 start_codon:yes stop_codon:yes gene_type:complete
MDRLIEIIKEIDIGKYTQDEYREVVDTIVVHWKATAYDKILDENGWRDIGGQS